MTLFCNASLCPPFRLIKVAPSTCIKSSLVFSALLNLGTLPRGKLGRVSFNSAIVCFRLTVPPSLAISSTIFCKAPTMRVSSCVVPPGLNFWNPFLSRLPTLLPKLLTRLAALTTPAITSPAIRNGTLPGSIASILAAPADMEPACTVFVRKLFPGAVSLPALLLLKAVSRFTTARPSFVFPAALAKRTEEPRSTGFTPAGRNRSSPVFATDAPNGFKPNALPTEVPASLYATPLAIAGKPMLATKPNVSPATAPI